VIHMGLLNVIRRMALREQLPIREIARRTGLSRNTVRKYLKSGAVEPKFATPERPSKLDPYAEKLAGWLKTEAGKGRKQRRTLKQLHADLVALGFTGSYNRVAAFAREWRAGRHRDEQTAERGTEPPRVYRRAKLSKDWFSWTGRRTRRARTRPSSARGRFRWWSTTSTAIAVDRRAKVTPFAG